MKHIFIVLFTVCAHGSFGADTLKSNITEATVFLSGAQVFRTSVKTDIQKGVGHIVIADVSPQLNPKELQATAKGNFLILDVKHVLEYQVPQANKSRSIPEKVQKEMNVLNDSLLFISFDIDRLNEKLSALQMEKKMIVENPLMKGGGRADSLEVLQGAMLFYREKLDDINRNIQKFKKALYYVKKREEGHAKRLNELKAFENKMPQQSVKKERHHILITTYAEQAVNGSVEVNYLVPNAGWIPSYDLRADNTIDPMNVTYKAHVYQHSGEDWNNVKLTLSTFNQNCFTTKPTLGIWRLDYRVNQPAGQSLQFSQNFASQSEMNNFVNSGYVNVTSQSHTTFSQLTSVSKNFSNIEFEVKLPYSVKADGEQKLMVIDQREVPSVFRHYGLPRANKNGFLLAKVGNWEELNLLPGEANIYFEKTYVGKTQIDPAIMQDTMEVALGRDQGIILERKKLEDAKSKSNLGRRIQREITIQIVVKNTTQGTIVLDLEDQIPVTKNEDIQIKLKDSGEAEHVQNTGTLTWAIPLKPGESRKVEFTYMVEHDKNKPIS